MNSEVVFNQASHTYECDGQPLISVTKVISELKPVFDKDTISKRCALRDGITQEEVLKAWEDASLLALAKGSATHAYIEDLFQGRVDKVTELCNETPEIRAFKSAWSLLEKNFQAKIVKQELILGDPELGIAGTTDAIAKLWHPDPLFHVFDWKTGKKFDSSNRYEKLLPPFQDLDNCHLVVYSLQTSIYRLMLERKVKREGKSGVFGESYLVHLRPDGTSFLYRGRDYRERVLEWLLSRKKVAV